MLEFSIENGGNKVVSRLFGSFLSEDTRKFNAIMEAVKNKNVEELVLDISGVERMDSSALGALFVLFEMAEQVNKKCTIINPQDKVAKILKNATLEFKKTA